MSVNWHEIKSMLENFNKFYWSSEMVNHISLINDLRLSSNIHETAHSRILYKLLCAHGKEKHQFLKMFLESVGLKLDIDKAEIKVEYKHIDVLIYDGTRYVIIENKVNHACDQDRQIETYIRSLYGKDVYVLYLVRSDNDKDPSEDSLSTERRQELVKDGKYKKISYQTHILNWLRECKDTDFDHELLKSALVQYCNYIEELFKGIEIMNDTDANNIKNIFWGQTDLNDSVTLFNNTNELQSKIKCAYEILDEYKCFLCAKFQEEFKEQTGINEARINSSYEIEFGLEISNVKIKFIYDFLNLKHYGYIWFGVKYPLTTYDGESINSFLSIDIDGKMKSLPEGYELEDYDNYETCADEKFRTFYCDKNYFCKYCKDNKTAVEEIKKYKEKIESLGTNNNGC